MCKHNHTYTHIHSHPLHLHNDVNTRTLNHTHVWCVYSHHISDFLADLHAYFAHLHTRILCGNCFWHIVWQLFLALELSGLFCKIRGPKHKGYEKNSDSGSGGEMPQILRLVRYGGRLTSRCSRHDRTAASKGMDLAGTTLLPHPKEWRRRNVFDTHGHAPAQASRGWSTGREQPLPPHSKPLRLGIAAPERLPRRWHA